MKKNISEKIKFDIDLTPLLDVIFIVLMVVMCKVNLNNAAEAAEAPGAEISESSEEAISESMKEKLLEELTEIEDRVTFVIIYADFEDEDPTLRHVRCTVNGNEDPSMPPIDIDPDNEEESYDKIRTYLTRVLEDHAGIPVWMAIDDAQILYRDYVKIQDILSEIKGSGVGDLYISEETDAQ